MEGSGARSFDTKSVLRSVVTGVLIALGLILVGLTVAQIWIGFGQGFPRNQHHMPEQELFLYAHFAASLLVFILLPLQLFKSIRLRMGRAHRSIGHAILILMVPSAIGGISLATTVRLNAVGKLGFGLGGAFWLLSAFVAIYFARKKKWRLHQAWAEIFAAMTLGAVAIRLEYPLFRELGIAKDTSYVLAVWTAWFGNLAIVLTWQRKRGLWPRSTSSSF